MTLLPIHFLQVLGIEGAEETARLSLPASAVLVGSPLPCLRSLIYLQCRRRNCPHGEWLPLEGKLSPKVTDEVN